MHSINHTKLKFILLPMAFGLALVWLVVQGVKAETHSNLTQDSVAAGSVRVVEESSSSIILELVTTDFEWGVGTADGYACDRLNVEGYALSGSPGFPSLPVRGAMIGIPPEVTPQLSVLQVEWTPIDRKADICPAAQLMLNQNIGQEPEYKGEKAIRDVDAYHLDVFLPSEVARLTTTGYLRSQHVAHVLFQPFQYNPMTGELRHYQRIRVQLSYQVDDLPATTSEILVKEGNFESLLENTLVNYQGAKAWRVAYGGSPSADLPFSPTTNYEYKLLVDQDGIYQVSYEALEAAGADLTVIDPTSLNLINQGVDQAIYLIDDGDNQFEPGESFLFYGKGVDTKYTGTNIYYLTWGGDPGKRMLISDGDTSDTAPVPENFTDYQHLEDNTLRQSTHPSGPDDDVFYWDYIYGTSPTSKSFLIELNHIAASSPVSATIGGLIKGYEGIPYHFTRILINNHEILTATWASLAELAFSIDIPQSYLVEGSNYLTFDLPMTSNGTPISRDVILINWLDINYRDNYVAENDMLLFEQDQAGLWEFQVSGFTTDDLEVLDISDPTEPLTISNFIVQDDVGSFTLRFEQNVTSNRRYFAHAKANRINPLDILPDHPSDLRNTANGADYIIISHGDFITAVQPLADHRASQPGTTRTMVIDIEEVYDEFSGGLIDPVAIHDFLQHAYHNWQPPAPSFVLLVGDGHFDPRDYYHSGDPFYIPPYLEQVDPWLGETAAENRFVTIVGQDTLPDMYIGRFPVRTLAETQVIVDKILHYEADPPDLREWNGRVLFVADNPDSAGTFNVYSDNIANNPLYLPAYYTPQKLYYLVTHPTTAEVTAGIIQAVNQGVLLVNYIGHAGLTRWADPRLFHVNDIASFTNNDKYPFFVAMTCLEGAFHYFSTPTTDNTSMAERLLRADGKGSVGSWSPTGLGVATGHDFLNRKLYESIFTNDIYQLGPAIMQAKVYLYNNSVQTRDLVDTYALIGDPAMKLHSYPDPTAVTLASFKATGLDSLVLLEWEMLSELDVVGYNLYRATSPVGERELINPELIPIVPGNLHGAVYKYQDTKVQIGETYYYWLEMVGIQGSEIVAEAVSTTVYETLYLPILFKP